MAVRACMFTLEEHFGNVIIFYLSSWVTTKFLALITSVF